MKKLLRKLRVGRGTALESDAAAAMRRARREGGGPGEGGHAELAGEPEGGAGGRRSFAGSPYPERTPGGHKLHDHLRGHRHAASRVKEVPPETIDDVLRTQKPVRVDSDGASIFFDAQRNVTIVKNSA